MTMNIDMNQVVEGVVIDDWKQISADEDSKKAGIHKKIRVYIKYDGLTLRDVFAKAFSKDVIAWQNSARKNYEQLKDGQDVHVSAKAPGAQPQLDPIEALKIMARANGVDVSDSEAFTAFIAAELSKKQ
jgi:hypothetical protein